MADQPARSFIYVSIAQVVRDIFQKLDERPDLLLDPDRLVAKVRQAIEAYA